MVLPRNAIRFCLQFANITIQDVSYVVYPGITYKDITKILETYFTFNSGFCPEVKVVDHHMAHALHLLEYLHEETRSRLLCLAGGVALNALMNQKLMESKFLENVHLTSAGDNGLSLGAAIIIAKENGFKIDKYQNPFWGAEYTNEQIGYVLTRAKVRFEHVKEISKELARLVAQRKIIGRFQGRMELGTRAPGSRSILFRS
jgi:predicted NodU family carbamoyl transferase